MPTENTLWSGSPEEAPLNAPPTCNQCPSRIWRHGGILYVSGVRATHGAVWPKSKPYRLQMPSLLQPGKQVAGPITRLWFELLCLEHSIQATIDGAQTTDLDWTGAEAGGPKFTPEEEAALDRQADIIGSLADTREEDGPAMEPRTAQEAKAPVDEDDGEPTAERTPWKADPKAKADPGE